MVNFKGIYYDDNEQKFTDEETGAHFRFEEMYQALLVAKEARKIIDKRLKVVYPEDNDGETPKIVSGSGTTVV